MIILATVVIAGHNNNNYLTTITTLLKFLIFPINLHNDSIFALALRFIISDDDECSDTCHDGIRSLYNSTPVNSDENYVMQWTVGTHPSDE